MSAPCCINNLQVSIAFSSEYFSDYKDLFALPTADSAASIKGISLS